MGRFASKDAAPASTSSTSVDISVGARCQVHSTEEDLHKRGTVRFVGPTQFGSEVGVWIGVEYDEPFGKNSGSWVPLSPTTRLYC